MVRQKSAQVERPVKFWLQAPGLFSFEGGRGEGTLSGGWVGAITGVSRYSVLPITRVECIF